MVLSDDDLKRLKPISLDKDIHNNGGHLYLDDDGIVYKLFYSDYFFPDEVERNVDFLICHDVPHSVDVYDKIYYHGMFYGYTMEYILDSITFREVIGRDIPFNDKIRAIMDVYGTLRYLHDNGMFLGDIHLDNFLYTVDGRGYVIDLDDMMMEDDQFKFKQKYCIKFCHEGNKVNQVSMYTDNIKLMLCSLSLLFDFDIEKMISRESFDIDLESVYELLIQPINNLELSQYFVSLMHRENVVYFDEILSRYYSFKSFHRKEKLLKI